MTPIVIERRIELTRDEIVELRAKGLSWERIACELGCSVSSARELVLDEPRPLAKCGGSRR